MRTLTTKFMLVALLCFGVAITQQSCTDECKDVTCLNGGTCDEGDCTCPTGFSGDRCGTEDKCVTGNITCLNGGTCDPTTGTCDCAPGFEGDNCGIKSQDKFVAQYITNETCDNSGADTYNSTIATSSDVTKILIADLWAFDGNVEAIVDGSTFTIPNQEPDNDGFGISGDGSIDENGVVTLNWTITQGANTATCSGTMTPQ